MSNRISIEIYQFLAELFQTIETTLGKNLNFEVVNLSDYVEIDLAKIIGLCTPVHLRVNSNPNTQIGLVFWITIDTSINSFESESESTNLRMGISGTFRSTRSKHDFSIHDTEILKNLENRKIQIHKFLKELSIQAEEIISDSVTEFNKYYADLEVLVRLGIEDKAVFSTLST